MKKQNFERLNPDYNEQTAYEEGLKGCCKEKQEECVDMDGIPCPAVKKEYDNPAVRELCACEAPAEEQPMSEIKMLHNELDNAFKKITRLESQVESAYKSKQALDQQFTNYKTLAELKLLYVQTALNNIHQAMRLIGGNN